MLPEALLTPPARAVTFVSLNSPVRRRERGTRVCVVMRSRVKALAALEALGVGLRLARCCAVRHGLIVPRICDAAAARQVGQACMSWRCAAFFEVLRASQLATPVQTDALHSRCASLTTSVDRLAQVRQSSLIDPCCLAAAGPAAGSFIPQT